MFSSLSLGKKIILGFSIVLVLLGVVALTGITAINGASDGFSEYREMAVDSNLSGRLQANMLLVRLGVKEFINTGSQAAFEQYDERSSAMTGFLSDAQEQIQNTERAGLINDADIKVVDYQQTFTKVVDLRNKRNELVKNVLDVRGPRMEKNLTEIMLSANEDDDITAAYHAGLTLRHVLLGRLYMAKFLDTNDASAEKRVYSEFREMDKNLQILDSEIENPQRRNLLESVAEDRKVYESTFVELTKSIYERNDLIKNRLDVLGPQIADDIEQVKLSIIGRQDKLGPALVASNTNSILLMLGIGVLAFVLGIGMAIMITRSATGSITKAIKVMDEGSYEVAAASSQVSNSSQHLAVGASQQASSLEEISSNLEEMAAMTRQNADNAVRTNQLSQESIASVQEGSDAMEEMTSAINKINDSSAHTAKIMKTINEIAFQTNLLALNAAVEAAKAGEAGKGFAVVAEEVRNLAHKSSEAAKHTASLIEDSQKNAAHGVRVTNTVREIFDGILSGINKVHHLNEEVSIASQEQSSGITELNRALSEMEKVTQDNAANAEESASASEELSAQAANIREMVGNLKKIVGMNSNGNGKHPTPLVVDTKGNKNVRIAGSLPSSSHYSVN